MRSHSPATPIATTWGTRTDNHNANNTADTIARETIGGENTRRAAPPLVARAPLTNRASNTAEGLCG